MKVAVGHAPPHSQEVRMLRFTAFVVDASGPIVSTPISRAGWG